MTELVVVFRTFPIRVAGAQAGPLSDEITWDLLQRESGYPYPIQEFTTVSKRLRRIGRFDWDLARKSVIANRPTRIAVNGLDYLDFAIRDCSSVDLLTKKPKEFLQQFESELGVGVSILGTGPGISNLIVRKTIANAVEEEHAQVLG